MPAGVHPPRPRPQCPRPTRICRGPAARLFAQNQQRRRKMPEKVIERLLIVGKSPTDEAHSSIIRLVSWSCNGLALARTTIRCTARRTRFRGVLPWPAPFCLTLRFTSVAMACRARKDPSNEKIQKAIEDLASPRFAARAGLQGAVGSRCCRRTGSSAEPPRARTRRPPTGPRPSRQFDWGLYPDTPADVVNSLRNPRRRPQHPSGGRDRADPAQAPRFSTLRNLVAQEQDENVRAQIQHTMAFQAPGRAALILGNQLDEANDLLEICVSPATRIVSPTTRRSSTPRGRAGRDPADGIAPEARTGFRIRRAAEARPSASISPGLARGPQGLEKQ